MSNYSEVQNKSVTCRKKHRCEWCAGRIEVGERAQYRAYRFDGDFHAAYMHPECHHAMLKSPLSDIEEGWTEGDFERGATSDGELYTAEGAKVPDPVTSLEQTMHAIQTAVAAAANLESR